MIDDVGPNLIGRGAGRIQIDQFGSDQWRAVLSIFNGPMFRAEAAVPSEALRLVLIEADREASDKMRRYRQAMNDRAGDDLAAAVGRRAREDAKLIPPAVDDGDDFDSLAPAVTDDFEGLL